MSAVNGGLTVSRLPNIPSRNHASQNFRQTAEKTSNVSRGALTELIKMLNAQHYEISHEIETREPGQRAELLLPKLLIENLIIEAKSMLKQLPEAAEMKEEPQQAPSEPAKSGGLLSKISAVFSSLFDKEEKDDLGALTIRSSLLRYELDNINKAMEPSGKLTERLDKELTKMNEQRKTREESELPRAGFLYMKKHVVTRMLADTEALIKNKTKK